ncbi:GNAT family N-acetyltransferase [Sediminibacillus massiliensis]|uniref:GNAT family N-acetyltransferase n=1 Tax=Sediminibacillus massiliensis TaxID=1926277 RepID=UPI001FE4E378|nr:GNAT family N-acetyltransferase [Sediminibacillus massiliensis]
MIRKAVEKDVDQLADLMGELGYPTTVDEMRERFKKIHSNPLYCTFIAEHDGKVAGMVGMMKGLPYEKNESYVRIVALVVHSVYRNQGIGESLMKAAEEWAKSQGASKLVLNSGNREERKKAHQFYISRGFEGKATGFYKSLAK